MKILLDTHVWLWYMEGDERLSKEMRTALASRKNELWLSPVSVWEVLLLGEKGKITLSPSPREWAKSALAKLTVREAPLTSEVAFVSREISLSHEDPADRFLAATAVVYDLKFATQDKRLKTLSTLLRK